MRRGWITGVTLVLALTLPSMGSLLTHQDFGINSNNGAGIVGAGLATSTNLTYVNDLQTGSDRTGMIRTVQAELGVLGQGAMIGALDGFFGVDQTGVVTGSQTQMHPGANFGGNLGSQVQAMNVGVDQGVSGSQNGHGLAVGVQAVVGVEVQLIATPWGVNVNLQPVMANVYDAVGQN